MLVQKEILPDPLLRSEMVQIVVDAVMKVVDYVPSKKDMDGLAFKIASKYPKSFSDMISGVTLGNGYQSLSYALYHRVHYVVRRNTTFTGIKMKSTCSVKNKKSYRCVKGKWNPELFDFRKITE